MQFAHPKILWLLLIMVPLIAWYIMKQRNSYPAMSVSSASPFAKMPRSAKARLRHLLFILKMGALGCMIVALARPQTYDRWHSSSVEGTDIVIAMDVSSSMLARDFKPDRLQAAKEVAIQFINGRENDNMGLVIFAGEALTGVPLTSDRGTLINYVQALNHRMLNDGTAIGDGLATSINRITGGKAKSKTIILLTDGSNNTGVVAPVTAAEIAASKGIKVYTIGIGSNGMADYPDVDFLGRQVMRQMPVVIDEATLRSIADATGGKYFRATNKSVLNEIFAEIDKLETTTFDVRNFSHTEDNYWIWALIAIGCVGLEAILRQTLLRTIP